MVKLFSGFNSVALLRSVVLTRRLHCRSFLSSQISEIMKLYTDRGNPFLLSILAAKNLAGVPLTVQYINYEDGSKFNCPGNRKLPVLEAEHGILLYSTNSICRYLLDLKRNSEETPDPSKEAVVDQWVEWESITLQPVLFKHLVSSIGLGRQTSRHFDDLMKLLTHADQALSAHKFFSGDQLGLADVILWGSLHPLFISDSSFSAADPQMNNVKRWYGHLMSQDVFHKSSSEVTGGKGVSTFKDSLLAMSGTQVPPSSKPQEVTKSKQSIKGLQPPRQEKGNGVPQDEAVQARVASSEEIAEAVKNWNHGSKNRPKSRRLVDPILPIEGEKNILITSALPYVNNVPHLGNIIGCVLSADVFARYCRLRQYNTLYICGTDEYGTATETKALEEGLTPQQICDKYFKIHKEVYEWFKIKFDFFGRTTTQQQTEIAQDIFWRLHKQDHLVEDTLEQLQCVDCKRFLADRFVEGTCPFCNFEDARGDQCDSCGKLINAIELKKPRCKVCGGTPKVRSSKHLFLNLTKLESSLKSWVDKSSTEGTWTSNARHITRGWIQEGLRPRCITRDLKWGTPVPLEGYTDKVFYVWFDAPIGYLSITANYTKEWEKWWKNPQQVTLHQFMAKDNVPFHTVVFPCTLIGADDNYSLLNSISATEYLNYEDDKFSKSRGLGVFGNDAADTGIPADIWRFYLLYMRPENQDSAFSWTDFVSRNNSELLNNFGNFINRALMFVQNFFGGAIPIIDLTDEDKNFIALINKELKTYIDDLEKMRLREGLRGVLNISRLGNQYFQSNQPWVLVKGSESDRSRAGTVISLAANLSWQLSVLIHPYMPGVSEEIQRQLQVSDDGNVVLDNFIPYLQPGHKIGKPKPLFQKIDASVADQFRAKYGGNKQKKQTAGEEAANTSDGNAADMDVATLQAEITKQGDKVRKLKTEKAEKEKVDAEVAILLALKKKLAVAEGKDPNEQENNSKGKKKGKKK
ncbi:methionine--tRNA ligase, cytoplasmic-like isoform X1 [Pocillopora damicornis]|uniref:methionine--tRNA ligase, cytoplasmic-like isoform X1 n=1 Tax=Pocillopora damicornis TaxID=46731 RepID=UPI000F55368E|nr:methionine--tRNA ligase, cytoplasmic-like isoform X1 [Pocillopora damicornis]